MAALTELHANDPMRRLALRADSTLQYSDVRDVFFRIQEIGFPGVSLMVSHKYRSGAGRAGAPAGSLDSGANAVPAAQE
jgi:hypothetical protein